MLIWVRYSMGFLIILTKKSLKLLRYSISITILRVKLYIYERLKYCREPPLKSWITFLFASQRKECFVLTLKRKISQSGKKTSKNQVVCVNPLYVGIRRGWGKVGGIKLAFYSYHACICLDVRQAALKKTGYSEYPQSKKC